MTEECICMVPFEHVAIEELEEEDARLPRESVFDRVVADNMRRRGCPDEQIIGLMGYIPTPLTIKGKGNDGLLAAE